MVRARRRRAGWRRGPLYPLTEAPTVAIDPMAGVSRDATSNKYVPATAAEWTATMSAAGISSGNPTHLWMLTDAASPIVDDIGNDDMTETGGGTLFQQSKTGWTKTGIAFPDNGGMTMLTSATYNSSTLMLAYIGLNGDPAATRSIMYAQGEVGVETGRIYSGDTTAGAADASTTVRPVIIKVDRTNSVKKIYTDQETIAQTYASATNVVGFGSVISSATAAWVGYSALWTGSAAELSDAQIRTLMTTLGWSPAW